MCNGAAGLAEVARVGFFGVTGEQRGDVHEHGFAGLADAAAQSRTPEGFSSC